MSIFTFVFLGLIFELKNFTNINQAKITIHTVVSHCQTLSSGGVYWLEIISTRPLRGTLTICKRHLRIGSGNLLQVTCGKHVYSSRWHNSHCSIYLMWVRGECVKCYMPFVTQKGLFDGHGNNQKAYMAINQLRCLSSVSFVTEFVKRGLIHASNFPTLTSHNFICKQAIKLKFSVLLVQWWKSPATKFQSCRSNRSWVIHP